jgi:hypothetical protein
MLCAREERLEDLIVRAVITLGAVKAESAHAELNSRGGAESWSLAATYKALRKLVDNGVLVHSKGRYYIAQSWIFSLSNLIDQHLEMPLNTIGGEHLLPPSGGNFLWRYTDLRRLNSFASNKNILLLKTHEIFEDTIVEKLQTFLRNAGFKLIVKSAFGKSTSKFMRDLSYFDQTYPQISVYVEAIKTSRL